MANPEHVKILKQGVEVWNKWREENWKIKPDLQKANFSKADLSRAELSMVNLTEANLSNSNLRLANLSWAIIYNANLYNANLFKANFYYALLYKTNLSRANLCFANLHRVGLSEADLNETRLQGTIFGNTALRFVKNLNLCKHLGPSIIDFKTMQVSWPLPKKFLRGCGLPDNYIESLPTLIEEAIQFYSCFISYSHQDEGFAERLYADLQDEGIRCWFAPEDMKIGDKIRSRIDDAIRIHDKLLLILSENSINSQWVEKEVETAFEKEKKDKRTVLFPIKLDESVMESDQAWAADIRRTRYIGDFRDWKDPDKYQKAFERLLRDLKVEKEEKWE